ncbi:MAG: flavin-dependent dehydrogenase [Saprospiraceae bacterium]|jgi:flavin-dependent dehydrogenase
MSTTSKGKTQRVIIIGGGLAGLVNAIHLSKNGVDVRLIEKNQYPKHKVCGEYISKEVLPYLSYLEVDPFDYGAVDITRFELSTSRGKTIKTGLPLGGFGISRYTLDDVLYRKAIANGVRVYSDFATDIKFIEEEDRFLIICKSGEEYQAEIVIGAFGKRSNLDMTLGRSFVKQKSPYLGVKSHYKGEFPSDLVALHNFEGGYCGVSKVENDHINICYLTDYSAFKKYKNTETFQEEVLCENPHLKEIFNNCESVFDQPLTISQVSFLPKPTVENHLLMSGDSAGMIHPLCGNGMGMAIHSGLILSQSILAFVHGKIESRDAMERQYSKLWDQTFRKRLMAGRLFNCFFGRDKVLEFGLNALTYVPSMLPRIIKQTHGELLNIIE